MFMAQEAVITIIIAKLHWALAAGVAEDQEDYEDLFPFLRSELHMAKL